MTGYSRSLASLVARSSILALTVVLVLVVPATLVEAHSDPYAWSNAGFGYLSPGNITLARLDSNSSANFDTAEQKGRVNDAIYGWNLSLQNATNSQDLVISSPPGRIEVRYQQFGSQAFGYTTFVSENSDVGFRAVHGSNGVRKRLQKATVYITPRTDWFARDNSWRVAWERCGTGDGVRTAAQYRADNPVLCASRFDMSETIIHEVGHGVARLADVVPEVDVHIDSSQQTTPGSDQARCGDIARRATICAGAVLWKTARRTLDAYDNESLRRSYVYQAGGNP